MYHNPRIIAFYLPQFYPIKENNEWWGKGFTEWTNVGKAKPLYPGHYQPKIPADLGYYDLRVPETRIAQAELAKEAGIEGFCYWHYWFGGGKRLLERPFNEVLTSGQPDFPFCLGWANHSWAKKTWTSTKEDKLLIEQTYLGLEDYTNHFYEVLPAFKDNRYIKVDNKPLFLVWAPLEFPDMELFINHWNDLAKQNGLPGIYFVAFCKFKKDTDILLKNGFNSVSLDLVENSFHDRNIIDKAYHRILRLFFSIYNFMDYRTYSDYYIKNLEVSESVLPCIVPNYDHSPRSRFKALIYTNSTPKNFEKLLNRLFNKINSKDGEANIVFIKSWNEWAEGNYLEPDLKYGKEYIYSLKRQLRKQKVSHDNTPQ